LSPLATRGQHPRG